MDVFNAKIGYSLALNRTGKMSVKGAVIWLI